MKGWYIPGCLYNAVSECVDFYNHPLLNTVEIVWKNLYQCFSSHSLLKTGKCNTTSLLNQLAMFNAFSLFINTDFPHPLLHLWIYKYKQRIHQTYVNYYPSSKHTASNIDGFTLHLHTLTGIAIISINLILELTILHLYIYIFSSDKYRVHKIYHLSQSYFLTLIFV